MVIIQSILALIGLYLLYQIFKESIELTNKSISSNATNSQKKSNPYNSKNTIESSSESIITIPTITESITTYDFDDTTTPLPNIIHSSATSNSIDHIIQNFEIFFNSKKNILHYQCNITYSFITKTDNELRYIQGYPNNNKRIEPKNESFPAASLHVIDSSTIINLPNNTPLNTELPGYLLDQNVDKFIIINNRDYLETSVPYCISKITTTYNEHVSDTEIIQHIEHQFNPEKTERPTATLKELLEAFIQS